MNVLQADLTIALPVLVAFVSGLIQQDKLPAWANDLIAGAIVLAVAGGDAYLAGAFLSSNLLINFFVVVSYTGIALSWTPLANLRAYLQSNLLSLGKAAEKAVGPSIVPVEQMLAQIDIPVLAKAVAAEMSKKTATPAGPKAIAFPPVQGHQGG